MISLVKNALRYNPLARRVKFLADFSQHEFTLNFHIDDLTDEYYQAVKQTADTELEHQIGRLVNFKKIVQEIKEQQITGDVIEFGTWRGFSLIWTAYLLERAGIFTKKIIGLDSFGGLPNTEGVFEKGAFSDTSVTYCKNNIYNASCLYDITKRNIFIEQFLFSEKAAISARIKTITPHKFCFIHIDCDISSSLEEVFSILKENDLLADSCYILFDDYGCMDSYKKTVDTALQTLTDKFTIQEHSHTRLTKNFLLKKK